MPKTNASATKLKMLLPYLGLACTSLFWAGNALVARGFNDAIPPLALAFYRWLACAILISPFIALALWRHRVYIRRYFSKLLVLAFLSITCYNSLLYISAQHTTALNITLVNALMPVTTLVMAIPLFHQRLSVKNLLGTGIAFFGAVYVILQGRPSQLLALQINQGDAVMALAMFLWSAYSVLLRKWSIPIPGFDLFAILLGLGLLILTPFYHWNWTYSGSVVWTTDLFLVVGYVAVFPSLLAYLFWNYGIAATSPSTAALFAYLTPLLTGLLAIPLLQETPQPYHAIGGLAILLGLYLSYDIGRSGAVR